MNSIKNVDRIYSQIKICHKNKKRILAKGITGPPKIVSLPLILDENLACIVGMILGDGHLKKDKCRVDFEVSDKYLIEFFAYLVEKIFSVINYPMVIIDKRKNRKKRYRIYLDSAPAYFFLNKIFNIPIGKKSAIIEVPSIILKRNRNIKNAFLIGVLLTDGGKRGKGFGLSTASKKFRDDLVILFQEKKMKLSLDEWEHKKYKKRYYGLCFRKEELSKIMRGCRSGQTGQILQELSRKFLLKV